MPHAINSCGFIDIALLFYLIRLYAWSAGKVAVTSGPDESAARLPLKNYTETSAGGSAVKETKLTLKSLKYEYPPLLAQNDESEPPKNVLLNNAGQAREARQGGGPCRT